MKKLQESLNDAIVTEANSKKFSNLQVGDPIYRIARNYEDDDIEYNKFSITEIEDEVFVVEDEDGESNEFEMDGFMNQSVMDSEGDGMHELIFADLDAVKLKMDELKRAMERKFKEILSEFK